VQAVGLKTHIWNNNFRSLLLLAGFPVLLIGMVWAGQIGLIGAEILPSSGTVAGDFANSAAWLAVTGPLALVASAAWYGVAFVGYQGIIDLATGAKRVTRAEQPELYNLLENLCISRGQPMPQLRIVDSEQRNAWASGLSDKRAVITVTRGLVESLDREELECVLAHELTHVINRDARLLVIAAIFAGIITLMAEVIVRVLGNSGGSSSSRSRKDGGGGGGGALVMIAVAVAIVGYLLAIVIRFAISRRREFIADAGAVELTKNPDSMISALLKISGHSKIEAPDDIQAMFFDHHEDGFAGLMESHPPIEKRVQALVKFAGGRMPEPASEGAITGAPAAELQDRADGRQGPWGDTAA
jgi:heat shock protein HtpX